MKTNNSDPYDIKKFEEVLGESYMMIPDSDSRLKQSVDELSSFMKNHEHELKTDGTWFDTAKTIIQQHNSNDTKNQQNNNNDVIETNVSDLKDDEEF